MVMMVEMAVNLQAPAFDRLTKLMVKAAESIKGFGRAVISDPFVLRKVTFRFRSVDAYKYFVFRKYNYFKRHGEYYQVRDIYWRREDGCIVTFAVYRLNPNLPFAFFSPAGQASSYSPYKFEPNIKFALKRFLR